MRIGWTGAFCALLTASVVSAGQPDVLISEIIAVNDTVTTDEDGDPSDVVELFNNGAAVNLDGWHLTDDPFDLAKWRFPAVTIEAGAFLVVFASDKDRRNPCCELHLNFKLTSGGEFLGLVDPAGNIVHSYAPFPPQVSDFSYGLSMNGTFALLVGTSAPLTVTIPSDGGDGLDWTEADFDDSGWTDGTSGVGYDRNADYGPYFDTDVRTDMEDVSTSCYVRYPFTVDDPASLSGLFLRIRYDDGFIAYINGVRVASRNGPANPQWDSLSTAQNNDGDAVILQEVELTEGTPVLVSGQNVLAIHGLNRSLGSSDFLVQPELTGAGTGELDRNVVHYFPNPSPGFGNLAGFAGISETPAVAPVGGVYSGQRTVTISVESPTTEIRYTLNGGEPTESSTLYTGPFLITSSVVVRAKGFEAGIAPSPPVSQGYISVAADVLNFTSDLPVVLVDNFGGGGFPSSGFEASFLATFEPGPDGRTRLSGVPALETRAGVRIRGSSTLNRPKKAYAVEFWDDKNDDKDLSPFGLPSESDWILYGAYNFDRALMRNAFIYEVSNQIGRYAVRTLFCEVYVNTGGGSLSQNDYVGVYSFMEKIKRGKDRVDVEKLTASIDSEPDISGGYMLKIDRADGGDSGFRAGGQDIKYVEPKETTVSSAQANWIQAHLNSFRTALDGGNFGDPVLGYLPYIDRESWVEHHFINELAKNPDGLRLSTYLYKKRGERIEYGPVWDFDRCLGPDDDGRAADPNGWSGSFNYGWWGRLFQDVDFYQSYRDRWTHFRRGPLALDNLHLIIDSMADEIREGQVRNFQTWNLSLGGGWQGEVNHLKSWVASRVAWIDSQFPEPPIFSSNGGEIDPGFVLTMAASGGTIYFTLDGTDPRLSGGGIDPAAAAYSALSRPELQENTRVVARTRQSNSAWSGPTEATFVVEMPAIVITELMYHPLDPPFGSPYDADDFEFVEMQNLGAQPIDMRGARLTGGIQFEISTFAVGGGSVLGPGEHLLVVKNLAAFESRYGLGGVLIAGEYTGNLNNSGDTVGLEGPLREPIHLFDYSELWYPSTDGDGDSLNIVDPFSPLDSWGIAQSWVESVQIGGSPGAPDDGLSDLGGRQIPGDSNQDGALDISDGFSLLLRLYSGEALTLPCEDGATIQEGGNSVLLDVSENGVVDLSDVLFLLNYVVGSGPAAPLGDSCIRIDGCPDVCLF